MKVESKVQGVALAALAATALVSGCGPEESWEPQAYGESAQEIVGGTNASIAEFPWQISFQTSSGGHFCGGSILNANWILTAQHCVDQAAAFATTAPASVRIAAGSSTLSGMATSGQIRAVTDVITYPGYVDVDQGKDVALLRLASPLTLGTNVNSIALATPTDATNGLTNAGVTATVTGWGTLSSGGSSPNTLQKVNVPIITNTQASTLYGQTITADQLAAGDTVNGGEDSCQGDSGGPLIVSKGTGKIVAGVVSWGRGCAQAQYPGLYARVSSFQSWIAPFLSLAPTSLLSQSSLSATTTKTWRNYTVTVPTGAKALTVSMSGGSGDGDLYVRQGSAPTTTAYTCRPYGSGNNENCTIPNPASGTWYVSIYAYSTYSGVSLRASRY